MESTKSRLFSHNFLLAVVQAFAKTNRSTMRTSLASVLVLLLLTSVAFAQTKPAPAGFDDRVIIKPRTLTLIRRASLVKGFPEKRTARVTYPLISGLRDVKALRRVQSLLQVKNVFDSSIDEYRQDIWLYEFGYKVNYNRNHVLDVTFTQSGSGAYPDTHTKHFAINLKDGSVIKATDVFMSDKAETLSALVNNKLQGELRKILKELRNRDPEDMRIAKEAQEPLKFTIEHLDEFSIGAKGITFLYDAGYPHVIQAFEPIGEYFFSYSELKPFIKRDGLLGQFID
jgi:hypothetical protein